MQMMGLAQARDLEWTADQIAQALGALLDARSLPEFVARCPEALARLGCSDVAVWWPWPGGACTPSSADVDLLHEAADAGGWAQTHDGRRAALLVRKDEASPALALLVTRAPAIAWSTLRALLRPAMEAALETARLTALVRQLERSEQAQSALFTIADMASSDMDMPDMLRELHGIVGRFMYAENFFIALYDETQDTLRFLYFVDAEDTRPRDPDQRVPMRDRERGLTWYLIRDRRPLMGSGEQLRQQVSGPIRDIGADCYDWLGVPMLSGSGVRGVLVVQSYVERPRYTAADQALLSYVGSHILTALDRKQAQEELEQRVIERTHALEQEMGKRQHTQHLQETLYRIAELSNTARNIEDFYGAVHGLVGEFMDARNFYIAVLDDDNDCLRFPYFVDGRNPRPAPRRMGRGVTEYVLRQGKPLLIDMTQPPMRAHMEALIERGEVEVVGHISHVWLGVPLVCSDRTVGVMAVQSYTPGVGYTSDDQELLTFISYQIANGLERQRAASALKNAYADLERRVDERTHELSEQIAVRRQIEERLKHEALHDSLTGLPNRAYLRDELLRCLARAQRDPDRLFAVLFMDLDRFKVINDSAGHLVGDKLLVEVARRFSTCIRTGVDVVARLGGDEFAIIMDDIHSHEDAMRMGRRVIDALREPVRVDDKDLFTSASVGIALSGPSYHTPEELLRDADIAMYRAKADDRARIEVFDEHLHRQALQLLELESDLRRAIAREEFEPYFQPIVNLRDARVLGFEALIRWNHPTRGVLAPGMFLPAAEASGCLEAIDWLMFESTFRVCAQLLAPDQYVNLNFSPRHFRNGDLDTRLLALLARHTVPPSQVRIEVTEGTLMHDPERVAPLFQRLREAGVLVALDDFGTGYSSLSYLHRFPLRTVKIDRSFIADLNASDTEGSTPVVRAILALSQSQSLEVVAEGIETAEQRERLLGLGCELGQGYYFARPRSLDAILADRET